MDETHVRMSTYGIFVRFRKSRLALRKGITSLPLALEIAAQLRADRLHGQRDIFIVKQPEGTIVELPPPEGLTPAPPVEPVEGPAEPMEAEAPHDGAASGPKPRPPSEAPSAAPEPPSEPPPEPKAADSVRPSPSGPPRAPGRMERLQQAIARSHAARVSFERAVPSAATGAELPEIHERLNALHAATCRVTETFEAIALTIEKRTGT